jgi:LPS export ABC transporter permease LptG
MLPSIVDTYILSEFFFYFAVWLVSFIAMTHVYNFFELMGHILRNNISMWEVAEYHLFLTPKLIYDSAPYSVLVAVLATFAILSKQNEVTAFKACGVSLYRLSLPVLMACVVLSAGLFAFDHYIIPDANLRQDGLRNKIMGKATQTWLRPDRKWVYGMGSRIFYYKHFDAAARVMVGVHVYELDKATFQLRRHISADRAEWQDGIHSWIFQNGWVRDLKDIYVPAYSTYQATTFPELEETPGYFLQEEKQYKQMNFQQLESYIQKLQQMGFDTVKLQVQYHRKFSAPLFALIMAALAVPFAFLTGSRGSMASIGVSFIVAILYGVVTQLFEKVGNLNQLPPAVAAWAPDVVFALFAAWLFTRMRS